MAASHLREAARLVGREFPNTWRWRFTLAQQIANYEIPRTSNKAKLREEARQLLLDAIAGAPENKHGEINALFSRIP